MFIYKKSRVKWKGKSPPYYHLINVTVMNFFKKYLGMYVK